MSIMLLKAVFHIIGAAQFCYGCYYDMTYVRLPGAPESSIPMGGKLKYLTFINGLIQAVYFFVALINDVCGTNEPRPAIKPLIRLVKDGLFSTLAFPVALFVGSTFWGIYAVDRELILPRRLDPIFPLWLNHVLHTNIVVFILLELLTSFRMYPTRRLGLTVLSTFMLSYAVWIHVIYYNHGTWVYPVLSVLNLPLRIVFFLFGHMFVSLLYVAGEKMNESIWAQEVQDTVKHDKKKAQ